MIKKFAPKHLIELNVIERSTTTCHFRIFRQCMDEIFARSKEQNGG